MWSMVDKKRKKEKKRNDVFLTIDLKNFRGKRYPVIDFKEVVTAERRKAVSLYMRFRYFNILIYKDVFS